MSENGNSAGIIDPVDMYQVEVNRAMEAEQSVIGFLMHADAKPEHIATVTEFIDDPEYLYDPKHRRIFKGILALYNDGCPTDPLSVFNWMADHGLLDGMKSMVPLLDLTDCACLPLQLKHHTSIILDAAIKRRVQDFANGLLEISGQPGQNVDEILGAAAKDLISLENAHRGDSIVSLSAVLPEVKEEFDRKRNGQTTGLLTGYSDLDEYTDGFYPGELIILAARPSIGKSAMALNIAENQIREGRPVGFISLEMKNRENAKRLILSRAKVDFPLGKNRHLDDQGWRRIDDSIVELEGMPLYFNDHSGLTISRLRSVATKMRLNYGIQILIVDYLQLLNVGRVVSSRNEEVSMISRSLKNLAGDLGIPILSLSQLSRDIEKRGVNARPKLSDLRDSGSLEQDADIVIFIHPIRLTADESDGYSSKRDIDEFNAELIVAKHRNGRRGIVKMHFVKNHVRWELGKW
jgi:replicative DNA helicase